MKIVRDLDPNLEPFDEDMDIRQQVLNAVELGVFLDQLCGLVQITPTLDEFTRPHYQVGLRRLRMMLRARTNAMTSERVGRIN
ncbi:MAG TPA: hypothetical protein VEL31_23370 [Ktedonobacteraceae bacterium]|nr:hypothetical protein [Ktedonobacteraceae bacterium]